jgi:hypothetical protein
MATVFIFRRSLMYLSLIKEGNVMDIDDKIIRVKTLIDQREEIDAELAALFGISVRAKKTLRCSKCGEEGHNAKTCTTQSASVE